MSISEGIGQTSFSQLNRLSSIAESFSYQYTALRFHLANLEHGGLKFKIGSLQETPHLLGMYLIHREKLEIIPQSAHREELLA